VLPWREYFASGEYAYDINQTAAFGARGKLAVVFGELLTAMRDRRGGAALTPNAFKRVVGRFEASHSAKTRRARAVRFVLVSNAGPPRDAGDGYVCVLGARGRIECLLIIL
jgi:hypothetical protein